MTKEGIQTMIRRLSDLAELLDNPNLTPTVAVEGKSAGYLLRSIAVELGRKVEEVKE
jgi:hypothetical protein